MIVLYALQIVQYTASLQNHALLVIKVSLFLKRKANAFLHQKPDAITENTTTSKLNNVYALKNSLMKTKMEYALNVSFPNTLTESPKHAKTAQQNTLMM